MDNIYITISLLSNLIFFQSTAKKNNKNLYIIMCIMFSIKTTNFLIANKYNIDSDKLMFINFMFSMLYARAL